MTEIVPPVTVPVSVPELAPPDSPYRLADLARELAMGLDTEETILSRHGLTPSTYETINKNEFFSKMLAAAKAEWHSIGNTTERASIEAAYCFEQAMPKLYARMIDNDVPLNQAVECAKMFAKAAGIGEGRRDTSAADKFTITINLGEDSKLSLEQSRVAIAPPADPMVVDTVG